MPIAARGPAAGCRRSGVLHGIHLVRASVGARDTDATAHWITALADHERLTGYSRKIVVVSETPFGPIEAPGIVKDMNAELARYNVAAQRAAAAHGALFLDVWTPFTTAARHLDPGDGTSGVWSDSVHLSELGDTVLLQQAERLLVEHRVVDKLLDYPLLARERALTAYGPLLARYRAGA